MNMYSSYRDLTPEDPEKDRQEMNPWGCLVVVLAIAYVLYSIVKDGISVLP